MTDRVATYRLQLRPEFGFDAVAAVAPYLARLGVSHAYCSPYLQAAPGSTHGYDVVDPSRVSDDLGGPDAHRRMVAALGSAGVAQVIDIVPNHLATGHENPWWWDVLENGRTSRHATTFDIDWEPAEAKLRGKVLLAVLGDQYGRVLERGELAVRRDGGRFVVTYYEHRFPVSPRTADGIVAAAASRLDHHELAFLAHSLERLPSAGRVDPAAALVRHRDKEVLARLLEELAGREPAVAAALDDEVHRVNSDHERLHALLERQNYRLAHWRVASEEVDYRRFFDIATLVGLRIEREDVLAAVHALPLAWLADGSVDGLRVDHPDGLRDPETYLRRLRGAGGPGAWIVVEKILTGDEELPGSWPVEGTTGYEAAARLTALFVDPVGEGPFTAAYTAFVGDSRGWAEIACEARREVLDTLLAADVTRVVDLLADVCERHPDVRDTTRGTLRRAVRELATALAVYRTYGAVDEGAGAGERHGRFGPADASQLDAAVEAVLGEGGRDDLDPGLLGFLRRVLGFGLEEADALEAALRFQQLTGPAMAKGVEDTAGYRYHRLLALNEVGSEPDRFGLGLNELHAANRRRLERWPASLVATSTHDTKRSEDVRARLALLASDPSGWAATVERWSARFAGWRRHGLPRPSDEWLIYQTLVGAWPLSAERLELYLTKALREGKEITSWLRPDPEAEAVVLGFARRLVQDHEFRAELETCVGGLLAPGRIVSLALKLLALTGPGVPDVYQGTEGWDLSLVDPDNRRPVDYERRAALLDEVTAPGFDAAAAWRKGADDPDDAGAVKVAVVHRALAARRREPGAFGPGSRYEALTAVGEHADAVVACWRGRDEPDVVVVAPRFPRRWRAGWGDTALGLPPGLWVDAFTGAEVGGGAEGPVGLGDLVGAFPVALLTREPLP